MSIDPGLLSVIVGALGVVAAAAAAYAAWKAADAARRSASAAEAALAEQRRAIELEIAGRARAEESERELRREMERRAVLDRVDRMLDRMLGWTVEAARLPDKSRARQDIGALGKGQFEVIRRIIDATSALSATEAATFKSRAGALWAQLRGGGPM